MERRRLGESGLLVSAIGLGTMIFGSQVGEADAHGLLDAAYDAGINFFDSAEMYAVPPEAKTYGESERILGSWLKTKPRESVVIATKIAGPNGGTFGNIVPHIRGGIGALDWHNFSLAVEGSLKRLGVETIDLYQTHWPDRVVPMEVQLEAFQRLIDAGKIRYAGVSNETTWGVTRLAALAEATGTARIVSVQNVYHLLKRIHETGMAEACEAEKIGVIAYSPVAMGVLTGKYGDGVWPPGTRLALAPDRIRGRYGVPLALDAAKRYAALAREAGLDPAAMAISWVKDRPGVTCALPGCSHPDQIEPIIAASELTLPADLHEAIEAVHGEIKNPVT